VWFATVDNKPYKHLIQLVFSCDTWLVAYTLEYSFIFTSYCHLVSLRKFYPVLLWFWKLCYYAFIFFFLQSPHTGTNPPIVPSTSTSPTVPISPQKATSLECDWSEHTCPDGYQYYYNCVSCESRVSFLPWTMFLAFSVWVFVLREEKLIAVEIDFCSGRCLRSIPYMSISYRSIKICKIIAISFSPPCQFFPPNDSFKQKRCSFNHNSSIKKLLHSS
jgi:hypothetical protein